MEQLANDLVAPTPFLGIAWVEKRRCRFTLGGCPVEFDRVLVNGAAIDSIAVEAEDASVVLGVVERIGIPGRENVNYARMVRRVLGLEFQAGQPWQRGESERD